MLIFDYAGLLERQCEAAVKAFTGEKAGNSQKLFSELCNRLAKDFLPPVDREDIASLSYELLAVSVKSEKYFNSLKGRNPNQGIKKQLDFLPTVTNGLLGKKKTCGDDIRRLVDMNLECGKSADPNTAELNGALANFVKTANSAFFKNL